jgi:hypothetical protein
MAWNTDLPDRLEAVSYTRDYSASSVFDELKENGGNNFSNEPEFINYYSPSDWKVYRITVTIEPVDE